MKEVLTLKKTLILLLAVIVIISCVFAACSKNNEDEPNTTEPIAAADDEYGFETQNVTDKDGKEVTDKEGNKVTTNVAVKYKTDKNGKLYAEILDEEGNPVKDDDGKVVTIPVTEATTKKGESNKTTNSTEIKTTLSNDDTTTGPNTTTTRPAPTGTTKKDVPMTSEEKTTAFNGSETVPKTTATGEEVNFSLVDQEIVTSMLEVPYLYIKNYENSDGVPIELAVHTAVWMTEREGSTRDTYPSSPIVLNLFKYYGQTVVNFKTKCNTVANEVGAPIEYISSNDTFKITKYTPKKQTVKITKIEDLGNNNFYKVTGTVSGCNKSKVVAVIQKNRLDVTLGFSLKAIKWS